MKFSPKCFFFDNLSDDMQHVGVYNCFKNPMGSLLNELSDNQRKSDYIYSECDSLADGGARPG